MIPKNTLFSIMINIIMLSGVTFGQKPQIDIVYPGKDALIGAVDSSFILGSVKQATDLKINDIKIPIHKDGGFIAFLPLEPGRFEFEIIAFNEIDTTRLIWPVNIPRPRKSVPYDSLKIMGSEALVGNRVLTAEDRLMVEFQATPLCQVWFAVPGIADSIPMAEADPQTQAYWGETVFGPGAIPESLMIKGNYEGFMEIGDGSLPDSSRIYYFLKCPGETELIYRLLEMAPSQIDYNMLDLLKTADSIITDSSDYFVRLNPDDYPRMVELTDSIQIIRVGPRKGYLAIFQPKGVKALAIGREGEWLKLRLSENQIGWIQINSVKFLEPGGFPAKSYVKAVRSYSDEEKLTIEIPLSSKHPFKMEEIDRSTAILTIYGVSSDTDWIRYDFSDPDIDFIKWSQPDPDIYQLTFNFISPIWGYDIIYTGNILKCQFNKPPQDINILKHKRIVIDPGHSPDPGAIGPTRLTESRANLDIALKLKRELENRGAEVIMTREDMSSMPLSDRPKIANRIDADLFISIHNNALPDGINPLENNGVSSYYYHLHSLYLAKNIQHEMIKGTDLNDYGLYHGNLAVNRPTQYPAVLIECAFIILPEHEALLKTEKFQEKVASSIRKGIQKFLKEYGRKQN